MADISRKEWVERSTEENIQLVEKYFETLNGLSKNEYEPGYTRSFIGIRKDGNPCNFAVFTPQKKKVVLGVKLNKSDYINNDLVSCVGADRFSYSNGWYNINVDDSINPEKLCAILLDAEKDFFASKKEVNVKEETHNSTEKKYWIFIHADEVRTYTSDEETVMRDYKSSNEDFEGELAEAIEEVGTSEFVDMYMADTPTDYFTRIHKVGVVMVDIDRDLSDYYRAGGDGFDYIEYEEGYYDNDEDISPSDFAGLVAWKENKNNIFVYELITHNFDIENLYIYSPENVEYDDDCLRQLNVDGEEGDFEIYKDGILCGE